MWTGMDQKERENSMRCRLTICCYWNFFSNARVLRSGSATSAYCSSSRSSGGDSLGSVHAGESGVQNGAWKIFYAS